MYGYNEFEEGLKVDLSEELKKRVTQHKNRFVRIFYNRYLEMLPTLIMYKNIESTSIDPLRLEVALMYNYQVVVGEANNGKIMMMGYVTNQKTTTNPTDLISDNLIRKEDITFIIPEKLIPLEMTEISNLDDCQSGNFVVIRNKTLNYVSDTEIIAHYTNEIAEVVLSRYSLTMQSKIITFFKGDEGDESINQLVKDLYNGAPIVKAGKRFDPDENMVTMENNINISQNFAELKREYQNKIGELNNMLGINSLAVEKSSGVSDVEAKSNRSFITSVANIKLGSRQNGFDRINKRFCKDIQVVYNDMVDSEYSDIEIKEGEENS